MNKTLLLPLTLLAAMNLGQAVAQNTADVVTLRANVINFPGEDNKYSTDLGVYDFVADPAEQQSFTAVAKSHLMYSSSGAVFTDDTFYSFYSRTDDFGDLQKGIVVRQWNTSSWEKVGEETYDTIAGLETYDMAYCAADGKYYGIFKLITDGGDDGEASDEQRLGTIDLATMIVSYISQEALPQLVYALAAAPSGDLYGIVPGEQSLGEDALVKFDKTSGAFTVVGSVGFKTQWRRQSACIDQRTGRMYWVGYTCPEYDAEGKKDRNANVAALYEVDLATGAATKIYNMPFKLQLAGLHVVGGDRVTSGTAQIEGAGSQQVRIYGIDGRLVFQGERSAAQLGRGIYVVTNGHTTSKIAVR